MKTKLPLWTHCQQSLPSSCLPHPISCLNHSLSVQRRSERNKGFRNRGEGANWAYHHRRQCFLRVVKLWFCQPSSGIIHIPFLQVYLWISFKGPISPQTIPGYVSRKEYSQYRDPLIWVFWEVCTYPTTGPIGCLYGFLDHHQVSALSPWVLPILLNLRVYHTT